MRSLRRSAFAVLIGAGALLGVIELIFLRAALSHGTRVYGTVLVAMVLLLLVAAGTAFFRVVLDPLGTLSIELAAFDPDAEPLPPTDAAAEIAAVEAAAKAALAVLTSRAAATTSRREASQQRLERDFQQRRESAEGVRTRAQSVIDDTVRAVITDLELIIEQVQAVRGATGAIDERVIAADAVTQQVVTRAHEADLVVNALGDSLRRVEGMTAVISQVAAQTNMLALNATIEAARAGAAGKGFAVVAIEVKGLARATADSTVQISDTIATLERDAVAVSHALTGMSKGVDDINVATTHLSNVAAEQRATVATLAQRILDTKSRLEQISSQDTNVERRASDRMPVGIDGEMVLDGQSLPIEITTLSDSGLSCHTYTVNNVPLKKVVAVKARLDGADLTMRATVMRYRDGDPSQLGLAFDGTDLRSIAQVRHYLHRQ